MNNIFHVVFIFFCVSFSYEESLEDIVNNLDQYYNETVNTTHEIKLKKINSSVTFKDLSFTISYQQRYLNESENFIQYQQIHVLLIFKFLFHQFSDFENKTNFSTPYLQGTFDLHSMRLVGSDDGDFVLQTPLGLENITFDLGYLSEYFYFNELFENNNYLLVKAFGNILTKRLKNILDNYPNSRPMILMRYMKKHLTKENVFYLIKGVEYGVEKATISEFDFAEYVKITYNSISFVNVRFTLWYIRNGKEYIEKLGFDHIIINEHNLYYDKVSPFHFVSDVIVHEILDRIFQNAKDHF